MADFISGGKVDMVGACIHVTPETTLFTPQYKRSLCVRNIYFLQLNTNGDDMSCGSNGMKWVPL